MNFELSGNLILKENTQDISTSFKKREFVIEVPNERNNDWNDFIKFQLTQDKCARLKLNYFSNLEAWRVEKNNTSMPENTPPPAFLETEIPPADINDQLPF